MGEDAEAVGKGHLTRRDRQRQETRQRVFLAALEIFRRDGVAGCKIDDIATLAGVSRGSFYFHFPAKEDVLVELLRVTETKVCGQLRSLDEDAHIKDVLECVARAFTGIWEKDPSLLPELAAVALRLTGARLDEREANPLRAGLGRRFERCSERGELIVFLPPVVMSDLYLANALAGMLAWCASPELPLLTVLSGVSTLFLHGCYPRENDDGIL